MKNFALVVVLGASLVVGASSVALAQIAEPLTSLSTATTDKKARVIKIKNVPSALMAYWLDPANNPRPVGLDAEKWPKPTEKATLTLPAGIKQIVSVDPQNALLISYEKGSEQSVSDLQELIAVLDQPLRQIELEAQIVEMSPEDAKILTFGVDFGPQPSDAKAGETELKPQIGLVKGSYTARLNALVADNRAKVLGTPRVTVASNFPGQLTLSVPRTLTLTAVAGSDPPATLNYVTTPELILNVVPIINGDDTLSFEIDVTSNATPEKGVTSSKSLLKSTLNLRDGDTWALKNLPFPNTRQNFKVPLLGDIPILSRLFRSKTQTPMQTFVFVTARIVRQTNETK